MNALEINSLYKQAEEILRREHPKIPLSVDIQEFQRQTTPNITYINIFAKVTTFESDAVKTTIRQIQENNKAMNVNYNTYFHILN